MAKHLVVAKDLTELGELAAKDFVETVEKTLKKKSKCIVALSGGETPKHFFGALTSPGFVKAVDWSKLEFFFCDERFVPHNDSRSNFKMARDFLFSKVPVKDTQLHPFETTQITAEQSAELYEKSLQTIDIAYLGVGEDGHTASLFPYTDLLDSLVSGEVPQSQQVAALWLEQQYMYRLTLLPSAINQSKHVVFLITGQNKADVVKRLMKGPQNPTDCPAQLIQPLHGQLVIFADQAAAMHLK